MNVSESLNLYWRDSEKTRTLIYQPFSSEEKLESYVFDNQELLGDVFILYRQIRTGSRQGIPDMIGVDRESRVCIIEMKNEVVSEGILPQVLGYAIWAETNPDSVKAIWLESRRKPEDVELDWDSLEVRVIVVAPSFKDTVPRMAGKIGYPIDLIAIRRFSWDSDEFLLVETLEEEPEVKVGATKPQREWDWDFYESEHGRVATAQVKRVVESLQEVVEDEGWDLSSKLTKYYVGFYLGNRVVFDVNWGGTHAWKVNVKVPEEKAKKAALDEWEFQRYDEEYHNSVMRPLDPETADPFELRDLVRASFEYVSGAI